MVCRPPQALCVGPDPGGMGSNRGSCGLPSAPEGAGGLVRRGVVPVGSPRLWEGSRGWWGRVLYIVCYRWRCLQHGLQWARRALSASWRFAALAWLFPPTEIVVLLEISLKFRGRSAKNWLFCLFVLTDRGTVLVSPRVIP